MFITREEITARTGEEVSSATLGFANAMVEAYIGKNESDITNSSDLELLAKATMFQAVYIADSRETLEQAGIVTTTSNGSTITFDVENMAPHMSPWAVRTCRGLSWNKSRSIHTGPIFDRVPAGLRWERE